MQWHLLTVFEYKESMGRSVGTWIGQCSCGIANFISFARIRHGVWHARIGKCMDWHVTIHHMAHIDKAPSSAGSNRCYTGGPQQE